MPMDLNRRLSQGRKVTGAEGKEYLKKRQIERVVYAYASGSDMTRFCIGIDVMAPA